MVWEEKKVFIVVTPFCQDGEHLLTVVIGKSRNVLCWEGFFLSSTFMILLIFFVEGFTAVEEGSATNALFVPLLAVDLGVAFSLPFLVAILKKGRESKLNLKR